MRGLRHVTVLAVVLHSGAQTARAQQHDAVVATAAGDSLVIQLIDVDMRAAVQALTPYLDRPVTFGQLAATHVTLQTPRPIGRRDVLSLVRGMVQGQGLDFVLDSAANLYRVQAREVRPAVTARSPDAAAPQLYMLPLHHARAGEIAVTVNALYGRATALGEPGGSSSSRGSLGATLESQLGQSQTIATTPGGLASSTLAPPAPTVTTGSTILSGETSIVADRATNSLLIRATPDDYALIAAAVRALDVRPLQVLISVVIAEVNKSRSLSLGLDFTAPEQRIKGTSTSLGGSNQSGLDLSNFALHVMRAGGLAFDATLSAAAARGDARILSRPIVLASNNEEAEILVGSQLPFVEVSQSTVGTIAQNQIVQYRDVGTRLLVTPTISTDGYVGLDITQEVNSATGEVSFNAPVISTRTVHTRLVVRDSQTVVLGGLSDRERDENHSGVPVLSSIPLLGALFGSAQHTFTDSEFYLFLTPRVVRSDADAADMTSPLEERAHEARP